MKDTLTETAAALDLLGTQTAEMCRVYAAKLRALSEPGAMEAPADLMAAVESILDDGHMNTEHLARLRAAWERTTPSQEAPAMRALSESAGAPAVPVPDADGLIDEFTSAHAAWNASPMENDVRERYRNARAALWEALVAHPPAPASGEPASEEDERKAFGAAWPAIQAELPSHHQRYSYRAVDVEYAEKWAAEEAWLARSRLSPAGAAAQTWISVEERLPAESIRAAKGRVLVFTRDGVVRVEYASYVTAFVEIAGAQGDSAHFTHWMPLPDPPAGSPTEGGA